MLSITLMPRGGISPSSLGSRAGDDVPARSIGPVAKSILYVLQVFGACFLAVVLTVRLKPGDFSSWKHIKQISVPRLSLAMAFLFAWLFCVIAGIVGYGIGLWANSLTCAVGMYTSVVFYSTSKFFVYVFLAEKVHVVWDAMLGKPRRSSPVYWLSMLLILSYMGAVGYTLCVARSTLAHPIDQKEADCYMMLPRPGAIALMAFDIVVTIGLTCMFVCPLWKNTCGNTRLRKVALRSVITVLITLPSSCTNMIIILVHRSMEHGWEFMVCWEVDLLISASALFWATSGSGLRPRTTMRRTYDLPNADSYDCNSPRLPPWVSGWPDIVSESCTGSLSLPGSSRTRVAEPDEEQGPLDEDPSPDSLAPPRAAMIQRHTLWPTMVTAHGGWQTPEFEIPEFLGDKQEHSFPVTPLKEGSDPPSMA